jgi:hypothetical protein
MFDGIGQTAMMKNEDSEYATYGKDNKSMARKPQDGLIRILACMFDLAIGECSPYYTAMRLFACKNVAGSRAAPRPAEKV